GRVTALGDGWGQAGRGPRNGWRLRRAATGGRNGRVVEERDIRGKRPLMFVLQKDRDGAGLGGDGAAACEADLRPETLRVDPAGPDDVAGSGGRSADRVNAQPAVDVPVR